MKFLVDTNIIIRTIEIESDISQQVSEAIEYLLGKEHQLYIVPQNLIEFWNVYTRPKSKNGFGYSPDEANQEIQYLKTFFDLIPDTEEIYDQWERLVNDYKVSGVQVHDARLVATMKVHQLSHILTYNSKDFNRYAKEIVVLHPQDISSLY